MKFLSFIAGLIVFLPAFTHANISPEEAESIATDVYIYAYPLITMDLTKEVMTNVVEPQGTRAPAGQFMNARTYPDASFTDVTAPNADTLYSIAWLDLEKEPYILHVPDEDGRYYLMPMLNGWTEVFAAPGTRTTGTQSADFAITGPRWNKPLPNGVQEFKSQTNMVWIIGRTYCTGTDEDYKKVHAIQDKYSLTPLSSYGKPYTAPKGSVNSHIDMKTPVREQVNALGTLDFFKRFAKVVQNNPPSKDDREIIVNMRKIGIEYGKDYDESKIDPTLLPSIEKGKKLGLEKILTHEKNSENKVNGWIISTQTGTYGTNYLQRALIAYIGLGANLPQDAIYPYTKVDSKNQPLNGKNRYVLHFAKGETPPIDGFWSLTMYNDQYYFVNNPHNRYTLSTRDDLKYNIDGSLDLYIQNENPGKDKESNWLPASKDDFILMLRLYWPKTEVLRGKWQPPAVKKVSLD